MMAHTPGPWMVDDRIEDEAPTIVGRNPRRATIATVENLKLADARLIAAAPDLLAALEMVADGYGQKWPMNVLGIVGAAIAKAKGE